MANWIQKTDLDPALFAIGGGGAGAGQVSINLTAVSNSVAGTLPTATTGAAGVLVLATSAEAIAGTVNNKAVSPTALAAAINSAAPLIATAAVPGIMALATAAEITAGLVSNKAVTPAAMTAALPAQIAAAFATMTPAQLTQVVNAIIASHGIPVYGNNGTTLLYNGVA